MRRKSGPSKGRLRACVQQLQMLCPPTKSKFLQRGTRLQALISEIRKQIDDRESAKLPFIQASNEEISNYQKQALLANERLVELDNAVKILTNKGPGGFLRMTMLRRVRSFAYSKNLNVMRYVTTFPKSIIVSKFQEIVYNRTYHASTCASTNWRMT